MPVGRTGADNRWGDRWRFGCWHCNWGLSRGTSGLSPSADGSAALARSLRGSFLDHFSRRFDHRGFFRRLRLLAFNFRIGLISAGEVFLSFGDRGIGDIATTAAMATATATAALLLGLTFAATFTSRFAGPFCHGKRRFPGCVFGIFVVEGCLQSLGI